jgi:hypothetical protein
VGDVYHISLCLTMCCADLAGAMGAPSGRRLSYSLVFYVMLC